jgi:repressor LexA
MSLAKQEMINVPLVGSAPCGAPLFAEENIEEMVPVAKEKLQGGLQYFILRATGDSMDEAGINDGDLILCKQKLTARENDIVAALINDEVTIKEFHREGDVIILKPRSTNPEHQPYHLTEGVQIQGIVQEVVKLFE